MPSRSNRLLCVGDLNADIAIVPSGELTPGTDTPGTVVLSSGGSAANVAVAATSLGTATRFAGVVGDDPLGRLLVAELEEAGVEARAVVRTGAASRSIAALIGPDGDRAMVSDLSTETVLRATDLDDAWFEGVEWLHLTAYSWFPAHGPAVWRDLVAAAVSMGVTWSVDPSSARMLVDERGPAAALEAFEGAAVLFPSHDEAALLSGQDDPRLAAEELLGVSETVAVTRGADGVVLARRGHETITVDAHEATVVNSLGCGDAFAGGFIAGRLAGLTARGSVDRGQAAAARVLGLVAAR